MIKFFTIMMLVVIAVLTTLLYHTRHAADVELKAIKKTGRDYHHAQTTQRVLQAEWVSLNNPMRLEKLAQNYLTMQPLRLGQIYPAENYDFAALRPDAAPHKPALVSAPVNPPAHTYSATASISTSLTPTPTPTSSTPPPEFAYSYTHIAISPRLSENASAPSLPFLPLPSVIQPIEQPALQQPLTAQPPASQMPHSGYQRVHLYVESLPLSAEDSPANKELVSRELVSRELAHRKSADRGDMP